MLLTPRDLPYLTDFRSVRPSYEASQADTLEWLVRAHVAARRAHGVTDDARFPDKLRALVARLGGASGHIARRGFELPDLRHTRWDDMDVYDVARRPDGAGARRRAEIYTTIAARVLDEMYAAEDEPPRDLVHVTCTGYAAPSAAQALVSRRGWGRHTRVTHAYHMGCYAAIPAIRIAAGAPGRADVVHDELCTLHLRLGDCTPEQLVVQSLFADGHVRYSVMSGAPRPRSLVLLATREEIAPSSEDAMRWIVSETGMHMTLARNLPEHLAAEARGFVLRLFEEAGMNAAAHLGTALFAVHPGGPRVLDAVKSSLELDEARIEASRAVLARCGNMSSATLPHVWMDLLADHRVPTGACVVSLAFGPGLTLAGALMVIS